MLYRMVKHLFSLLIKAGRGYYAGTKRAVKSVFTRPAYKLCVVFAILLFLIETSAAQIPVEVFGGHERSTVDIMFFKFFRNGRKTTEPQKNRWLFFNRNRASIDYRMTETRYLPQFGFTEAVSYNHERLKGFAPVLVVQVLSWGVYPKAGIQYTHITKNLTVFSWLVCETLHDPALDYFLLLRYTPKITEQVQLFTQAESVNAFPTSGDDNFSFTQRFRLGLQLTNYQFGVGADFSQTGRTSVTGFTNTGFFLRHEF